MIDRIEYIVVHHSGGPLTQTFEDIEHYHIFEKGFKNDAGKLSCGYQLVVEADGSVRNGRIIPDSGDHCPPFNNRSVGICLIGWNPIQHPWTAHQKLSLRRLVRCCHVFWPEAQVVGHRDVGSTKTECPGVTREQLEVILA